MHLLALLSGWAPPIAVPHRPEPGSRRERQAQSEQEKQARLAAAQVKRARRLERNRKLAVVPVVQDSPKGGVDGLDDDFLAAMADLQAEYLAGLAAEDRRREAALREVRRLVRKQVYREILGYIEDSGYTCDFSIVSQPVGDLQEEDEYAFKRLYVDQYCNGGYTGDDFAGWVCIPLNAGKFLKFRYSC